MEQALQLEKKQLSDLFYTKLSFICYIQLKRSTINEKNENKNI